MSNCPNCSHLQTEVNRLEVENRKLMIKVKKLETEIDRLRGVIYGICQYCYQIAQDAAAKIGGHLPRGEWAFQRGRYEIASVIYNTLRGE